LGYDFSIDYNGRVGNKPIRWDYYEVGKRKRLYQVWSALIHLRTSEPAFATSDYKLNLAYATKRIELNHADMDVRIIGNFDVVERSMDPNFSSTGTWYEFFSGSSSEITDPNGLITLSPGEYRIYTTKQLTPPEIITDQVAASANVTELKIYPNPAGDQLFISAGKPAERISLWDINGRVVKNIDITNRKNASLDGSGPGAPGSVISANLSGLESGIYLLQVSFRDGTTGHARIVKNSQLLR
jgi:hypothetical protein